ncbi:hypothetical protein BDP27DRAFT_1304729 [Rhodocollybia butyracea]|uniref:Terpene synthase n=1 Tax=Rhodocollybia butyracea TaxID=206335 RepID=A0A9P5TVV2_9AGAR|nr:hypothetical protein BDP27DRAFT_1304729 [Rhodocollybia butyracea]
MTEWCYPYADTEVKTVLAKLNAITIYIDDSLDDETMCDEISKFAHHVYIGESQPSGILNLYHGAIKELSHLFEGDPVQRGLAVTPWINFLDVCLLEKRLLTIDKELRASPYDMGYQDLAQQRSQGILGPAARETLPRARINFPLYFRYRSAIADACSAAIFKSTKEQSLPLSRYIIAVPDISFYVAIMNDLLSFHKEEKLGESITMIHLHTQSLKENSGTGASGKWTTLDTFNLLCDEVRDATFRIDELLRLQDCERIVRDGLDSRDMGLSGVDITIALQWRGFRDGYISWHLKSQRYKLDFIQAEQFQQN